MAGRHGKLLKIRVAAPAADSRANTALIELPGHAFDLPPSRIRIRAGFLARRKIVQLDAPSTDVESRLTAWERQ